MPDYEIKVTLPYVSGAATDVSVNTFAVEADDDAAAAVAVGQIASLYDVAGTGGTNAISAWFSRTVSRVTNIGRIEARNRANAPGSPPDVSVPMTVVAPLVNQAPLPEEVALAVSFRGAIIGGLPAARRRGRVFLGPFILDTASNDVAVPHSKVNVVLVDDIVESFADFLAASIAAPTWTWQVWSTVNAAGVDVEAGYVDNAFDTMRSRGFAPTLRTAF